MDDNTLKQVVAEKRTLSAWEAAVASTSAFLSRGLATVPERHRDLATSPAVVDLLCGLLCVRQSEALGWMIRALNVQSATENISESSIAFLFCRLAAFKQLIDRGDNPKVLLKVVAEQYADLRPVLGFPNIEIIIEEYIRQRSAIP